MLDLLGQDKTYSVLEATMDLSMARQSVLASNIANIDTPGYRAQDVAFNKELRIALNRIEQSELTGNETGTFSYSTTLRPRVFEINDVTPRQDGNTVDLDKELGKLSKTSSIYNKAVKIYGLKLKMLKSVLKGDA